MAKRYWRIRGYKGFQAIFDQTIPVSSLTEGRLQELLKCLAAKEGLSYSEIVGAYVKKNAKLANGRLNVQKSAHQEYKCGHFTAFTAVVVDEHGDRLK